MRVFFRIAIRVVHAVQNGIGSGVEVGRALHHPGEDVEKALPAFAHGEHLVRCVAVQEKSLTKKRKVPVKDQEQ